MSRFTKLFAANAIAAAGLGAAALALSPSAAAEPVVAPAIPPVPALTMLQQFATNPASGLAVLQSAASALNGATAGVGAPSTLPVSPIVGAPGVPAPAAPVAPIAPATPGGPATGVVPLLSSLGIPAQLTNLAPPEILPSMLNNTLGIAQAPAAVAPVATAPIAPAIAAPAAGAALNPLPLLAALP